MPPPRRRALPDNLDPLVDTLSNVVGILVIVVLLTQIQLGDALTRVLELNAKRVEQEEIQALLPDQSARLAERREGLLRRTEVDLEDASALARETLLKLSELNWSELEGTDSIERLEERLANLERTLIADESLRDQRSEYAEAIQTVPKRLVARLPNPEVMHGKESWILVRYGRIYLVDREALLEIGSDAIGRVLQDGINRRIRDDEFDTVALYLRKSEIGEGDFRWQLQTDPDVRVELAWQTKEGGVAPSRLASDPSMRAWLEARSSDVDFIRFQVWQDSYEAYLAVREVTEAAGFRAGWDGHESDEELTLGLRFGPKAAPIQPIEVD